MTVLVVSVDGVAPRHVTRSTMPVLTGIARSGAGCFDARTVTPSWTLPAHISLARGVSPSTHGVLDNTPHPLASDAPSFLRVARSQGLRTASFTSWAPLDIMFEPDAATTRLLLDDGYNPAIDQVMVQRTMNALADRDRDVVFSYLVTPDLCGHEHGWDSAEYVRALSEADASIELLLTALSEHDSVIITTDHGGLGHQHELGRPQDLRTFVVARSPEITPGTWWPSASILDVAPTVADLAGFAPDAAWEGTSLLGRGTSFADGLMHLLEQMAAVTYGEDVTMLEHAVQTAALAPEGDAALALSGLLHDVGHLLDESGPFGVPDHASGGADFLGPWLPSAVVEPIRGHVDAKRWLVTRRPGYADLLSTASQETLRLQGGPFSEDECDTFATTPHWERAVELRELDDAAKQPDRMSALSDWEPLLRDWLAPSPWDCVDPTALRQLCTCVECRDPSSGQRTREADTARWEWAGPVLQTGSSASVRLTSIANAKPDRGDAAGDSHLVILPDRDHLDGPEQEPWTADFRIHQIEPATSRPLDRDTVLATSRAVARTGVAIVSNTGTDPGTVLTLAEAFGFVRETNYGDLFDVRSKSEPENLAYSPRGLALHTDNPYRDPCPTVQLLHCLVACQDGGGETWLADGLAAAQQLSEGRPADFEILRTVVVDFEFAGPGVSLMARRPVVDVRPDGTIRAISLNERSMRLRGGPQLTRAHARAVAALRAAMDAHTIRIRLKPGDLLLMDNRRILHGRSPILSANRWLQGCYIDIDSVRSLAASSTTEVPT